MDENPETTAPDPEIEAAIAAEEAVPDSKPADVPESEIIPKAEAKPEPPAMPEHHERQFTQGAAAKPYQEVDVFAWANNLVQYRKELTIDLFLFSKKLIVYRAKLAPELQAQLPELFVNAVLDAIITGAGEGLQVRGFEEGDGEENVLQRVTLDKVDKAREVLNWIKKQEDEIEIFIETEHDMKRMKGFIARVSHPKLKEPAYIAKVLPSSYVAKAGTAWMVRDARFVPFDAEATLRVPPDNQVLIIDQDIFVFNQTRLKQLFGYSAKEHTIAETKIEELMKRFKLSLDGDITVDQLLKENSTIVRKLQRLDVSPEVKQNMLIDYAEELGLDLMSDDKGAIIILDAKDMIKFINLVNDDYTESNLTGLKYEIKSKRLLKTSEES